MPKAAEPCRNILFVTLEPISRKMAGPAIRAFELARALAESPPGAFNLTVFSPHKTTPEFEQEIEGKLPANMRLVTGQGKAQLYNLASSMDGMFIQANVLKPFPALTNLGKYIAVDLYDPYLFSVLVQYQTNGVAADASFRLMHRVLERHMTACDFSVCASERQRDYWIGRYCAQGRITPELYAFDPSLRKLIDVVPFGLPEGVPERTGKGAKGAIKGIARDDRLLLWGGGIWDWFDPLTVIKAVGKASEKVKNLRLFFMGMKSPNPQVPLMDMAVRAKELSRDLGLLDRHVFFHEQWIEYEDRVNYLLDADIGVSAHFDLPETRFSFRTRLLDYLWARLPILTTGGDQLAEMIEFNHAGSALPYEDADAWAEAIVKVLTNKDEEDKCRRGSETLAKRFVWTSAAEPLRRFFLNPHHLPEYRRVTMPSLIERAQAVYARGGKELVLQRSRQIFDEWLR